MCMRLISFRSYAHQALLFQHLFADLGSKWWLTYRADYKNVHNAAANHTSSSVHSQNFHKHCQKNDIAVHKGKAGALSQQLLCGVRGRQACIWGGVLVAYPASLICLSMPAASAASASSTAAFSSSGITCRPVWYQLPCPVTGLEAGALADVCPRVHDPRLAAPRVADIGPVRVAGKAARPSSSARLLLVIIVLQTRCLNISKVIRHVIYFTFDQQQKLLCLIQL